MTNFLPGLATCIVLLIFLAFISAGQEMYKANPNANVSLFANATEAAYVNISAELARTEAKSLNSSNMTPLTARLSKIIYRFADAGGYAAIQVANIGVEYGFSNPEFQAKQASDLLILLIYLEIAAVIFMPICAIVYGAYLLGVWGYRKLTKAT